MIIFCKCPLVIILTRQMEDECSIGNDETRIFILSSYATNKMNRVPCVFCKGVLNIFDRYPVIIMQLIFLSLSQPTAIKTRILLRSRYTTWQTSWS